MTRGCYRARSRVQTEKKCLFCFPGHNISSSKRLASPLGPSVRARPDGLPGVRRRSDRQHRWNLLIWTGDEGDRGMGVRVLPVWVYWHPVVHFMGKWIQFFLNDESSLPMNGQTSVTSYHLIPTYLTVCVLCVFLCRYVCECLYVCEYVYECVGIYLLTQLL